MSLQSKFGQAKDRLKGWASRAAGTAKGKKEEMRGKSERQKYE